MNPTTYNRFHTALALGESSTDTASSESTSSLRGRNITHWTQPLLIAGSVVATITAVAIAILTQSILALVCGVVCFVNLLNACYLRKFTSPVPLTKLVDPLADKVTTLFNDREKLSQAALNDKKTIDEQTAELVRLRLQDVTQKTSLEQLAKEKSQFEKAANDSSSALKTEKEKSETLEAILKAHIAQIERAPVASSDGFAIPAPVIRSRSASIPNILESPSKKVVPSATAGQEDVNTLRQRNAQLEATMKKQATLLALINTPVTSTPRRNSPPNVMAAIPLNASLAPLTPRRAAAAAALAASTLIDSAAAKK